MATFKKLAQVVRNFKNIPKTLAGRHQAQMCYQLSFATFEEKSCFGIVSQTCIVSDHPFSNLIAENINAISENTEIFSVTWCEISGTRYKPGALVVVQTTLVPQFGVIEDIVVVNREDCYFICHLFETQCFNHHFHCYEVTPLNPPEHVL